MLTTENEEAQRNYAIVTGFTKGLRDNIRDALDSRYYIQLKHRVFKYRSVTPIQYLTHIKDQWVILDKQVTKELTDHYLRGWNQDDKHIKGFALRLDEEQADLLNDGITITADQKKTTTCCKYGTAAISTSR